MAVENTDDDKKGWSIGDIISMLFGSALVVGIVGWIASSGIFGEQISAAIKSFVNQFLPEDMQFDDGNPMENYLRETAKNKDEFAALLQSDTFGPGLSPETAKAVAGEATDFLDALKEGLGEGGLESLVTKAGNLTFNTQLVKALADSKLTKPTKELLFAELLETQEIPKAAASILAKSPKLIANLIQDGKLDKDALITIGTAVMAQDYSALVNIIGSDYETLSNILNAIEISDIELLTNGDRNDMATAVSLLKSEGNLELVSQMVNGLKAAGVLDVQKVGAIVKELASGSGLSADSKAYMRSVAKQDVSLLKPLESLNVSMLPEAQQKEFSDAVILLKTVSDVDNTVGKADYALKGFLGSVFGGEVAEEVAPPPSVAVQPKAETPQVGN